MTRLDFSQETKIAECLLMMDGKKIEHTSLIAAFLPESNYGFMWRSVIDYLGGTPTGRKQVCLQTFRGEEGSDANN